MRVEDKDRLARAGDMSDQAAGFRLVAAIKAVGLSKTEFANRSGQQPSALSNSFKGRSFPSRQSMRTLYKDHRIDPAFIMFGDYGGLPLAVQDALFGALAALENGRDKSES